MSGRLGVVVLAAECSDRMRSSLPPALHTVAGVPAAQYVIDAARELSPAQIVVAADEAGHGREALSGAGLFVEGGGGLAATLAGCREALGGCDAVLVAPGDAPLVTGDFLKALVEARGDAPLALATPADGEQEGAWCADADWLWEHLTGGGETLASLAEAAQAEGQPARMVAAACAASLRIEDRGKLARAEAILRERLIAGHLAAGVTFRDPATVYLDRNVRLEADVRIEPNCYLYGETSVAAGAVIGPGATLRNATIGTRSSVEHSVVEDSTVGAATTVGPFAHVRGGAVIGDGCEIHNYAEIKNSVVGDGVKMHHFSYLGDADVGEGANIGAGAVTVNFDGTAKHRTHIGVRAFVGCDTMLIAPLSVGDGAFTAAGAVVTRDVGAGVRVAGVPARELREKAEGA